jgi:hypothetical protein
MTATAAILLLSLMTSPASETFLDLERRFAAALLERDGDRWRLSSSHVTTVGR